jgi:tetratricopeptide (TPR) repeat protein
LALIEIASEALKHRDKTKALEIAMRTDALIARAKKEADYEPTETEATRLSELAVLYSQLDRRPRAVELANLAFKTAKDVRKPGERYGALRSAANVYCELGLYDKAIDVTKALGDYDRVQFDSLAEVGEHAQRKGRLDAVGKIVKTQRE